MIEANFQVGPYSKEMDPSTLVYFLITNGMDGSYIVNDFVSRDVLPVFEKWPLTYATLAGILMSCDIGDPHLSLETYQILVQQTKALTQKWEWGIYEIDETNQGTKSGIGFDHLAWIQLGVKEIMKNKGKMTFAQLLNENVAKRLHEVLDSNEIPLVRRYALVKKILDITGQSLPCQFDNLPYNKPQFADCPNPSFGGSISSPNLLGSTFEPSSL